MEVAEKSAIGILVASLAGGGTGIAAWVDLNVGVSENAQKIEQVKESEQIHRDYIKKSCSVLSSLLRT